MWFNLSAFNVNTSENAFFALHFLTHMIGAPNDKSIGCSDVKTRRDEWKVLTAISDDRMQDNTDGFKLLAVWIGDLK